MLFSRVKQSRLAKSVKQVDPAKSKTSGTGSTRVVCLANNLARMAITVVCDLHVVCIR